MRETSGDPKAQYQYAQWLENHAETIQQVLPVPIEPDVYGGFAWLQKAAAKDYPPAVWLVGARLRYGIFVPRPADWNGPGGNVFEQPALGQPMMDHAVNDLGYKWPADAWAFYEQSYRKGVPPP